MKKKPDVISLMEANEAKLKKWGCLSEAELHKLGITDTYAYGDVGFVEPRNMKAAKKLGALAATGKYTPVTWVCEGEQDGFLKGFRFVNRFGYGLAKVSHG